jgi:hypothetical protein
MTSSVMRKIEMVDLKQQIRIKSDIDRPIQEVVDSAAINGKPVLEFAQLKAI